VGVLGGAWGMGLALDAPNTNRGDEGDIDCVEVGFEMGSKTNGWVNLTFGVAGGVCTFSSSFLLS